MMRQRPKDTIDMSQISTGPVAKTQQVVDESAQAAPSKKKKGIRVKKKTLATAGVAVGWAVTVVSVLLMLSTILQPPMQYQPSVRQNPSVTLPSSVEKIDADGDGLSDIEENSLGTDPSKRDSDSDGMPDGWEAEYGAMTKDAFTEKWAIDPANASDANEDYDMDGLSNLGEYTAGTYPTAFDSDGDGMPDGWEAARSNATDAHLIKQTGINPDVARMIYKISPYEGMEGSGIASAYTVSALAAEDALNATSRNDESRDPDEDGLANIKEYANGTNPYSADSDFDGLMDAFEMQYIYNTTVLSGDGFVEAAFSSNYSFYVVYTDSLGSPGYMEFKLALKNENYTINSTGAAIEVYSTTYHSRIHAQSVPGESGLLISSVLVSVCLNPANIDTDGDGMPDGWEYSYGLNPLDPSDAVNDSDADGLLNADEYSNWGMAVNIDAYFNGTLASTDQVHKIHEIREKTCSPASNDTDGDGMSDGWEGKYKGSFQNGSYQLDPTDPLDGPLDIDSDGLNNSMEYACVMEYGDSTNPLKNDTDEDGLSDYEEVVAYYSMRPNPTKKDTDSDGLTDGEEVKTGRPGIAGYPYGWQDPMVPSNASRVYHTNANSRDTDNDGLTDEQELLKLRFNVSLNGVNYTVSTNASSIDTDGDGLEDSKETSGMEIFVNGVNKTAYPSPVKSDTDADGLLDGLEVSTDFDLQAEGIQGTDPTNSDTDTDGMQDGWEYNNSDIDRDGLPTWWEITYFGERASIDRTYHDGSEDYDGDGLNNTLEYLYSTDPKVANNVSYANVTVGGSAASIPYPDERPEYNPMMHYVYDIPKRALVTNATLINPINDSDADRDDDADGLLNVQDSENNTDPYNADTDGDGMPDGWEITYDLNPRNPGDAGIQSNYDAAFPDGFDFDGSGIVEGDELLTNIQKYRYTNLGDLNSIQYNPLVNRSQADMTLYDFETIYFIYVPDGDTIYGDRDADGLLNIWERLWGLDPFTNMSLGDGYELDANRTELVHYNKTLVNRETQTSLNQSEFDTNYLLNTNTLDERTNATMTESQKQALALVSDTDGDGWLDIVELMYRTNPLDGNNAPAPEASIWKG